MSRAHRRLIREMTKAIRQGYDYVEVKGRRTRVVATLGCTLAQFSAPLNRPFVPPSDPSGANLEAWRRADAARHKDIALSRYNDGQTLDRG